MKILLINYMETTAPGGINKIVQVIAQGIGANGHDITILQINPQNMPAEEDYKYFKVIRLNSHLGNLCYGFCPEKYFIINKYIKQISPELIHVHGYHTLFSAQLIHFINKNIF